MVAHTSSRFVWAPRWGHGLRISPKSYALKILSCFVLLNNLNSIQSTTWMPICRDCGANFPLLKEADVCNKCRMLEGKSTVEKIVIKASCQLVPCQVRVGI